MVSKQHPDPLHNPAGAAHTHTQATKTSPFVFWIPDVVMESLKMPSRFGRRRHRHRGRLVLLFNI